MAEYWHQVVKINDYQRERLSKIIASGSNKQDPIAILGWAFKCLQMTVESHLQFILQKTN